MSFAAHVLIGSRGFCFVLHWNVEISLYTLDTSPLLDAWFANLFPWFVVCLFICLTGFLREKKFMFIKFSLSIFLLGDHAFAVKRI